MGVVPMSERPRGDVVVTAGELASSTEDVACKRWKTEQFEIYLSLWDVPARVTLDETRIRRVADGNPNPLEWRLSEEYGSECAVRGDLTGLVHEWFNQVDEFAPQGDRRD